MAFAVKYMKILITGGAGFIGLALAKRLVSDGHAVTVFDNLSPQIHGSNPIIAPFLLSSTTFMLGDVCDKTAFHEALQGQEVVVHLAAETGTGQSMYEVVKYDQVNNHGTSLLLDFVINNSQSRIKKLVVASSRAIYGEGKYSCPSHGVVYPEARRSEDMLKGFYEPRCPVCGSFIKMLPTDEGSRIHPSSFYGLTKQNQENGILLFARQLGLSGYALRYQNVYGPGQSLKNPYTGILAIFSSLARNNLNINIFEDGLESRDFVYIDDVIAATSFCIASESDNVLALNVGSGEPTSVIEIARTVKNYFNSSSSVTITGDFRLGDIRHNVADIGLVNERIKFKPQFSFGEGIIKFLDWALLQPVENIGFEKSLNEMRKTGIFKSKV